MARFFWERDSALRKAESYSSRLLFRTKAGGCYTFLVRKYPKDLDKLFPNNQIKFTKRYCVLEAKKYSSRTDFARTNTRAYSFLLHNYPSSLDKLFPKKLRENWTIPKATKIASKYSSLKDFREDYDSCYRFLVNSSKTTLEELFRIEPHHAARVKWTLETATVQAKDCVKKTDFKRKAKGAFAFLKKNYPEELDRLFPKKITRKYLEENLF